MSAVQTELRGNVRIIRLNRPEKLNAFNDEMVQGLISALDEAKIDPLTRAVVLSGTGRGFSAGQDLEAFVDRQTTPEAFSVGDHLKRGYNVVVASIRTIEKPVIAALNGIAAGVGLSIALACDLRIAADDAVLTLGFSKIGLIPDGGASFMLPLLVGFGRGLELAWSSDRVAAVEAQRIGLVNVVVPVAEFEAQTLAYAQKFADLSPVAVARTKYAFNRSMMPHLQTWLGEEADIQDEAARQPDLQEGVNAFLEKRKAAFAAR